MGAEKDESAKWMLMDFALIIKVQNILLILKSQPELRSYYLVLKGQHLSIYLFQVTSAITFITISNASKLLDDYRLPAVSCSFKIVGFSSRIEEYWKSFSRVVRIMACIHSWLNHRRMLYLHTVSHDQDDYKLQAATAR